MVAMPISDSVMIRVILRPTLSPIWEKRTPPMGAYQEGERKRRERQDLADHRILGREEQRPENDRGHRSIEEIVVSLDNAADGTGDECAIALTLGNKIGFVDGNAGRGHEMSFGDGTGLETVGHKESAFAGTTLSPPQP